MHIQIIFIGNNIPENISEAPLLGLAKSIYYQKEPDSFYISIFSG